MRRSSGIALLLFLCLLTWVKTAEAQQLDIIFTAPDCGDYLYAEPVMAADGSETYTATEGGFFCTAKDFESHLTAAASPVGQRLNALISSSGDAIVSVRMATYIFSELSLAEQLCDSFRTRPFDLEIWAQAGAPDTYLGVKPDVLSVLKGCFGERLSVATVGCDYRDQVCDNGKISTMHLKLLEVTRASGLVSYAVGSGNFGRGMYANFEDWFVIDTTSDDPLSCVWTVLSQLDNKERSPLGQDYRQCLSSKKVAAFERILSPFEADRYYLRFSELAQAADDIYVVTQDFKDRRLAGALRRALEEGTSVTLFASSDWYYANITGTSQGSADPDDIALVAQLRSQFPDRVSIRFVQNNFYAGQGSTVHHKFAVFSGPGGATVLTGTTNMNPGAIQRNLDLSFVFSGAAADLYLDYAMALRQRTTPILAMPATRPILAPGQQ